MTALEVDFDDPPAESFETATPRRSVIERLSSTEAHDAIRSGSAQAALMGNGNAPALGRTLPHSLEAEENLLSCCLLDGADVISRCVEARIRPGSFYSAAHGIVYEHLLGLYDRKEAIDISVIAEELKTARQLDAVGGYAFLTQVSSNIPTTAQATYFIEKVREQSLLREAIRAATGLVEQAYNFSSDIDGLLEDFQQTARAIAEGGSSAGVSSILARAFDGKKLLPKPTPIYQVAGTTICTRGNLTTIYSQAKTGKSSFIAAMMAATMVTPTSGTDTLGVEGPNYSKAAVLHFDTEQSPYDWQQLVRSCLRRAGLTEAPNWLMSFTIAGLEAAKAETFVQQAVRLAKKTHGAIHSIFIDGVADLVNDPNNSDECFPLVQRLHGLAIENDTAIVNILHLNPTAKDKSDKGRGHLGSQLERKSESNLTLKKEGEITIVVAEGRQRGRPIPADKAPAFRWSDDHGMHRSTGNPTPAAEKKSGGGRPAKYDFKNYKNLFPGKSTEGMELAPLGRQLLPNGQIPPKSLQGVLERWAEEGMIEVLQPDGRPNRYRAVV